LIPGIIKEEKKRGREEGRVEGMKGGREWMTVKAFCGSC
jgi:hypothetical protein